MPLAATSVTFPAVLPKPVEMCKNPQQEKKASAIW